MAVMGPPTPPTQPHWLAHQGPYTAWLGWGAQLGYTWHGHHHGLLLGHPLVTMSLQCWFGMLLATTGCNQSPYNLGTAFIVASWGGVGRGWFPLGHVRSLPHKACWDHTDMFCREGGWAKGKVAAHHVS